LIGERVRRCDGRPKSDQERRIGSPGGQSQEASLFEHEPIDRPRRAVRGSPGAAALLERWFGWAVPATPQERAAALWSFAYFFMLLAGYYILRPLRDRMGIAGGVNALPWMFTATFVTLLVIQPLYGALVARLPRARFIAVVYHFFVANLALFWLLLTFSIAPVVVARVFFVWVSVFSLFAVAVFWSFMADLFDSEQGKRLFGFIGAGGTAGSLLGPIITIGLSVRLGPVNLLIAAMVLLELAVFCVHQLERTANAQQGPRPEPSRVGGSAFAGFSEFFASPYLLGVGAWVSLLSFGATILYLEQANIVAATIHGGGAQTRIFASIDLAVGLLSLATQVFATGQLLNRFGSGAAAGALPAVYIVGFAVLAAAPSLMVVVMIQIAQRWMNFAIANPARQVFFTVVSREEKYKAKNFIDVVIYRGSDAFYGWMFGSLEALGLKIAAIALCALPVAAGWLALSAALGRTQIRRAAREVAEAAPGD
jgi:ATP:ADP antiporter, AAA family